MPRLWGQQRTAADTDRCPQKLARFQRLMFMRTARTAPYLYSDRLTLRFTVSPRCEYCPKRKYSSPRSRFAAAQSIEHPREGNRSVDYHSAQNRRPSSTMDRISEEPMLRPLRNRRIASITSSMSRLAFAGLSGTIRATGFPCRVIRIDSPWATRSKRAERFVFASKAPTVSIQLV